jgi:HAD superfamily hydrolase (TIGR01509 family)
MIRRELPPAQQDQAIRIFLHRYREDHDNLATVFKGVRPMLRALSESGVKLGIMTGKGRDTANITLAKLRWTDLFDSVITGDEITRIKPDPQGVLMVAAKLGIEPQRCAYVGDAPADIGAGKAAGMQTIYAAWHPVYAEQVKNLHPDATAFVPGEILRVLNLR